MLPLCHPSRGSARPTPAPMSIPAAFAAAARRKRHQTYPELARARRCRLVEVVGVQVRGRFGAEPVQLLRLLARQKAAITAWVARRSALLAVAALRAYAACLLELPPAKALCDGPVAELHEVLAV